MLSAVMISYLEGLNSTRKTFGDLMSLINLYTYHLPVQLSETNHGAPNFNRPMYNYSTKLYKNNNNIIDFVVRDNDRKPVKLIDCKLSVIVQNVATGITVLEKSAKVTDEIKGRAQLMITASETETWLLGGYAYNVKITRPGGAQEFLYVDIANSATGTFDLLPAVGGELVPAQFILGENFTPMSFDWDSNDDWQVSGAQPAYNQVGANTGSFTVAIYTTNWQGSFRIQASLQNLAPTEKSWFDIPLVAGEPVLTISTASAPVQSLGFSLNAQWIRFLYKAGINNLGSFDKVVYKIT